MRLIKNVLILLFLIRINFAGLNLLFSSTFASHTVTQNRWM